MELTIIEEGLKASVETYGLIYDRHISDGDSRTYSKILEACIYNLYSLIKVS